MKLPALLKEPLVHFLIAGGLVFVSLSALDSAPETGRTITVSDEDLLVFMQGRAQVYDAETFTDLLDNMSAQEREQLVTDAATQEALYREAQALGLAETDPLIRQRLVQQMRSLLMEEAAAGAEVSEAEVEAFYAENRARYRREPQVTFSHVFFPADTGAARLREVLDTLRSQDTAPREARRLGERFLYQSNYSEADAGLVESHFGAEFASAVFDMEPGEWSGPVRSEHGWHLVLPLQTTEAAEPELSEIADRVREDALAQKRSELGQGALDAMLSRYEIEAEGSNGS